MRVDTMHKQGAANIFQAPFVRPIFKQFERSVDIDDMLEWQQNRVRPPHVLAALKKLLAASPRWSYRERPA
jgi:hypothetical protein